MSWLISNYSDDRIIETILRTGADPNKKISQKSLLSQAVSLREQRIAALLIQYGAKVEAI